MKVGWAKADSDPGKELGLDACSYVFDGFGVSHPCRIRGTHTRTHTRLTALCPGLPGWSNTRKVKPIWILLKQEWQWLQLGRMQVCTSLQRDNHASTPPLRYIIFKQYRQVDKLHLHVQIKQGSISAIGVHDIHTHIHIYISTYVYIKQIYDILL